VDALEIRDLSKTFAGQVALDRVDLTVGAGQVHALVGQNGSGKSTLIKVLAGYHRPDPGAVARVRGRDLALGSALAAHDAGIRFVHQDLGLVLELDAVENLMLGLSYPRGALGRIRWREAVRQARERVARVGLDIDLRCPVGELDLADRTGLAIARALPDAGRDPAVLVLDEPTAALPDADVQRLLTTVRALRAAGHSVLVVSHRLDEVLDVADRVSVLRDGRMVATADAADLGPDTLGRLMVGHDLVRSGARATPVGAGKDPVLVLDGVTGGTVLGLTAGVRRGETVGVAGLSGSGRETVAGLLSGRLPRTGRVTVDGRPVRPASPAAALAAGMAFVPGERVRYGVFPNLSVRQNLTVGSLRRHARRGYVDARSERREVRRWIDDFGIVTRGPDALVTTLSGGNQQKVLIARALRRAPSALVLDDPTAGIDVKAREAVHVILEDHTARGLAVLLASTDSDELARLCDRVLVLDHGRVVRTLHRGADLSATAIDHAQVSAGAA
jgi:ribose transport system ATP-binding protein